MRVVIHQPHFLPWLGYFNKVANADVLVFQDNVQFRRAYFQNRTKIRTQNGDWRWLTIPIHASRNTQIKDVEIANPKWKEYTLNSLMHTYASATYYKDIMKDIAPIIEGANGKLFPVNLALMKWALAKLEIAVDIRCASEFAKKKTAADTLITICESLSADEYIFGEGGGREYHGLERFHKGHIRTYNQRFKRKFLPHSRMYYPGCYNLSVIDFLFVQGVDGTRELVNSSWRIKN